MWNSSQDGAKGSSSSSDPPAETNLLRMGGRPLQGVPLTLVERQFITLLVTGAAKDWLKKTPRYGRTMSEISLSLTRDTARNCEVKYKMGK